MKTAVEVEQLVREFKGGIRAVDGLDLEVHEGEIYGFLGPNGAGKTTVVRILTTLLRPTAGHARVAGHDVVHEGDAVRRAIGVALQEAAIDPLMTGRELLRMQGALHGLRGPEARERAAQLLERVGLTEAGRPPRRRLLGRHAPPARPRARARPPPARAVPRRADDRPGPDEPRSRCGARCSALHDEGTTVFLTTQYLEEAEQLADRVGIIARGNLVAEGTPSSLKARVGEPTVHVELADPQDAPAAREALAGLGTVEEPNPRTPTRVALRDGRRQGGDRAR